MQDEKIRVWPANQSDTGLPAVKRTDLAVFCSLYLWQMRFSAWMRVVNIIVPVDEENVVIYVRTYQRITKAGCWAGCSRRSVISGTLKFSRKTTG
jgi:hypothetical protein